MCDVKCLFNVVVYKSSVRLPASRNTLATYVDPIEQIVPVLLILLKNLDILKHLIVNRHPLIVPDRVLAEEVEDDIVWLLERNMLAPERATADRVRFVVALLIPGTQCKLVDEVHRRRPMSVGHHLVLQIGRVVLPDAIDVALR
jgi:hypothetical protein